MFLIEEQSQLSEEFSLDLADESCVRLPLFAIDNNENIRVFTITIEFPPANGWSILALSVAK